jgi:diadenosine tetraphosphate (Ap4A) HIT family hydrolase
MYVNINNTRNEEMRKRWEKYLEDDIDPFSRAEFEKCITEPIILEVKHWYVFKNEYPYDGRKYQFVIVTQIFFTDLDTLPDEVGLELKYVKIELSNMYGIKGSGLVMRLGDTSISGASVTHLHAQLIVPEENKRVAAWFGSEKKE